MKKSKKTKNIKEIVVVGIGASAGGLEALQEFFKNTPIDTGLAFVVIQHLSPDYKSIMNEILSRETFMKVNIIIDGIEIEPNNVYLIPPRKNISVYNNRLYLEEQNPIKSINLPIDYFFRSLAKSKNKNCIGVVLSGAGSDGSQGIKAIKEVGGLIIAQDPKTAKFDSMPSNAIATSVVDAILPPNKITEGIISYIKHPFVKRSKPLNSIMSKNIDSFSKILMNNKRL